MAEIKNKEGMKNFNKQGLLMTISKYINAYNIIVRFDDGYETTTQFSNFIRGMVRNPYYKKYYGVACIGNTPIVIKGKDKSSFICWRHMIERCYSEERKKKQPTYENCTVCEEWLCFENFEKWYDENFYKVGSESMNLDKDILKKYNKIYSPQTCVFAPKNINILFTKANKNRGNLPIGVCIHKIRGKEAKNRKYEARCCNNGKSKLIGRYNTPEEAFYAYKEYKENLIKQIADSYKDKIPQNLYEALYEYEVEITD